MSYLRGPDRSEVQLLPASFDDYVGAEAPVRFIDAYVEELDLGALGFKRTTPASTGRPGYHPADLLKLYLYGYLHRLRSSRRLESEAVRNLELIWLLRGVQPDFKTIADFRKDNRAAFPPLFKEFNLLCRRLELFGAELVAIDGSKFKAVNNKGRHYTAKQLKELLVKIDQRIADYLAELETQDKEAEGLPGSTQAAGLQEKIAQLKERKERYQGYVGELKQSGEQELSLTDADSRKMKGPHSHVIGYNVQLAVDAKHSLIVAEEVVQAANDRGELKAMAQAAKEQLQAGQLRVVADKGYHENDQLEACEQAGIETIVSSPETTSGRGRKGREVFPKERFIYDPQSDAYHCPAGQLLKGQGENRCRGKERILYYNQAACKKCPLRSQCTGGVYRSLARRPNEPVVERAAQRVAANLPVVKQRKEIIEHVFGTLRNWGHDRFLMRGLEKIRAEFSLSALAYNLRRVLNLVGWAKLRATCGT